jgi:uncharacterized membrane protein YdjX (TVP38/TMEM64 family)
VSWLYGKLQAYLAVAGAIIVAIAVAFLKGRKSGKEAVVTSINKQERKVNDQITKVDAQRPDLDASLERLRKRAKEPPKQ